MQQPTMLAARRKLQALFPKGVPPVVSIYVNNGWRDAVDKDPSGQQAMNFVEDLVERLTPMKG
jgi:hypothetical protein